MKFSIIHASYGRYKMATDICNRWVSALTINQESKRLRNGINANVEYIFSVDRSDPEFYLWQAIIDDPVYNANSFCKIIVNETNTSVAAINNAAKQCKGDIIIVTSDDFEPIWQWDLEILKVVEGKEDWILKTQDGTQPWIITLPIMDRKYYERFGYVYNPSYVHMFCDCEMTHVADLLGRKLTSSLLFKHNHYSVGGIAKDQTSVKADKTWDQGKKVYIDNLKRKFDLDPEINVMKLPPEANGHLKWLHKEFLG